MSSNPQTTYQQPVYQPPPSNGLGIAGFVVSLSGLIVCAGFICPIGLILSLIALRKEPRGFAVGGSVLGGLGTLVAVFLSLAIGGVFGGGFNSWIAGSWHFQTSTQMSIASGEINQYFDQNNQTLPDQATGDALVANYNDEWGTPLQYRPSGNNQDYELVSAGPDGVFGNGDDYTEPFMAFSFGTATTPHGFSGFDDDGPGEEQVNFAFNQAAERINGSFTTGQTMPDAASGTALIADLVDAWSSPMRYAPAGDTMFHIKSAGKDGNWLTDDDDLRSFFFEPTGGP